MNVFVSARATVTAGLANDVDELNQMAAVMYEPTASGTASGLDIQVFRALVDAAALRLNGAGTGRKMAMAG